MSDNGSAFTRLAEEHGLRREGGNMKDGTICVLLKFPQPWPPPKDVLILEQSMPEGHIALIANEQGRLRVDAKLGAQAVSETFQPIRFEGGGTAATLLLWWSDDKF